MADWKPEYTIGIIIVVLGLTYLIYRQFMKPEPKRTDWEIKNPDEKKDHIEQYQSNIKEMDEEIVVIANRAENFERQTMDDLKMAETRILQIQSILKNLGERLQYWEELRDASNDRLTYLNQGKKRS